MVIEKTNLWISNSPLASHQIWYVPFGQRAKGELGAAVSGPDMADGMSHHKNGDFTHRKNILGGTLWIAPSKFEF